MEFNEQIENLMEVKIMFETALKERDKKMLEQGIKQGELADKQNILIKLLSKKHGLEENQKEYIRSITDIEKLDTALEEILFSKDKKQVLDCLK